MNAADHPGDGVTADVERLARDLRGGAIGRRDFLTAAVAAGLAITAPRSGEAAGNEFVIANWGGPAATAFNTVWGPPVQSKLDAKLVIDGSGPSPGRIRSMVDSGHVTWDVCDASVGAGILLGNENRLEEIDYGIVGDRVRPEYRYKYAVSNYIFSFVLAFNRSALGGRAPASWKEFWNVQDFPGKRMLRGSCFGQLECALMADGVPPDKVYPIDLPRALKKIAEIKDHTVFWKTGSQSEDLFRQNEVVMGNMWHNRTNLLRIESKGNIDWTWAGGVIAPAVWVVPKHNPAGKKMAMEFIALSLEPEGQVELFKLIGMGPSNPTAAAMIPDDLRKYDPSQPANLAQQILIDDEWYGHNLNEAEAKYLDVISS